MKKIWRESKKERKDERYEAKISRVDCEMIREKERERGSTGGGQKSIL